MDRVMYRGDSYVFDLQVIDPTTGIPQNLAGVPKIWFTAKKTYVEADSQAAIALDLSSGVTVTDAAKGKIRVTIPPSATFGYPDGVVDLVYDVQIKDASGRIFTIESGALTVKPDVTRAIS